MSGIQARTVFNGITSDRYNTNSGSNGEQNYRNGSFFNLTRRERSMITLLIILMIILMFKSIVLDEVRNLPPDEQQFKEFVDYTISKNYSGALEDRGLLVYRVYDIYVANESEKGVLKYMNPESGEMVAVAQDKRYTGMVRGYFLWVFPVKHFSVTSQIEE